jgi:hypothetical protein
MKYSVINAAIDATFLIAGIAAGTGILSAIRHFKDSNTRKILHAIRAEKKKPKIS